MLNGPLLATIAGLAALDALNPVTIGGVALILLAPLRRPVLSALAFVVGAYGVVLLLGVGLLLGASAVGDVVAESAQWVRRGALLLAALLVARAGLRRFRDRERSAVVLPNWFGPWTAAPAGIIATGADLPNAFPYLIAIERLTAAQVAPATGMLVLAGYALVYCLPCLMLLVMGIAWRRSVTGRLRRVYDWIGGARTVRRSLPAALGLLALAAGLVTLAVTL